MLNDHTYCCQLDPSICSDHAQPLNETADKCYNWHKKRIGTRSDDAKRLGIPLLISEFGACTDDAYCHREIDQVAEVSDKELASWTYWEFKHFHDLTTSTGDKSGGFYNEDNTLRVKKVKALSRTYVKAA